MKFTRFSQNKTWQFWFAFIFITSLLVSTITSSIPLPLQHFSTITSRSNPSSHNPTIKNTKMNFYDSIILSELEQLFNDVMSTQVTELSRVLYIPNVIDKHVQYNLPSGLTQQYSDDSLFDFYSFSIYDHLITYSTTTTFQPTIQLFPQTNFDAKNAFQQHFPSHDTNLYPNPDAMKQFPKYPISSANLLPGASFLLDSAALLTEDLNHLVLQSSHRHDDALAKYLEEHAAKLTENDTNDDKKSQQRSTSSQTPPNDSGDLKNALIRDYIAKALMYGSDAIETTTLPSHSFISTLYHRSLSAFPLLSRHAHLYSSPHGLLFSGLAYLHEKRVTSATILLSLMFLWGEVPIQYLSTTTAADFSHLSLFDNDMAGSASKTQHKAHRVEIDTKLCNVFGEKWCSPMQRMGILTWLHELGNLSEEHYLSHVNLLSTLLLNQNNTLNQKQKAIYTVEYVQTHPQGQSKQQPRSQDNDSNASKTNTTKKNKSNSSTNLLDHHSRPNFEYFEDISNFQPQTPQIAQQWHKSGHFFTKFKVSLNKLFLTTVTPQTALSTLHQLNHLSNPMGSGAVDSTTSTTTTTANDDGTTMGRTGDKRASMQNTKQNTKVPQTGIYSFFHDIYNPEFEQQHILYGETSQQHQQHQRDQKQQEQQERIRDQTNVLSTFETKSSFLSTLSSTSSSFLSTLNYLVSLPLSPFRAALLPLSSLHLARPSLLSRIYVFTNLFSTKLYNSMSSTLSSVSNAISKMTSFVSSIFSSPLHKLQAIPPHILSPSSSTATSTPPTTTILSPLTDFLSQISSLSSTYDFFTDLTIFSTNSYIRVTSKPTPTSSPTLLSRFRSTLTPLALRSTQTAGSTHGTDKEASLDSISHSKTTTLTTHPLLSPPQIPLFLSTTQESSSAASLLSLNVVHNANTKPVDLFASLYIQPPVSYPQLASDSTNFAQTTASGSLPPAGANETTKPAQNTKKADQPAAAAATDPYGQAIPQNTQNNRQNDQRTAKSDKNNQNSRSGGNSSPDSGPLITNQFIQTNAIFNMSNTMWTEAISPFDFQSDMSTLLSTINHSSSKKVLQHDTNDNKATPSSTPPQPFNIAQNQPFHHSPSSSHLLFANHWTEEQLVLFSKLAQMDSQRLWGQYSAESAEIVTLQKLAKIANLSHKSTKSSQNDKNTATTASSSGKNQNDKDSRASGSQTQPNPQSTIKSTQNSQTTLMTDPHQSTQSSQPTQAYQQQQQQLRTSQPPRISRQHHKPAFDFDAFSPTVSFTDMVGWFIYHNYSNLSFPAHLSVPKFSSTAFTTDILQGKALLMIPITGYRWVDCILSYLLPISARTAPYDALITDLEDDLVDSFSEDGISYDLLKLRVQERAIFLLGGVDKARLVLGKGVFDDVDMEQLYTLRSVMGTLRTNDSIDGEQSKGELGSKQPNKPYDADVKPPYLPRLHAIVNHPSLGVDELIQADLRHMTDIIFDPTTQTMVLLFRTFNFLFTYVVHYYAYATIQFFINLDRFGIYHTLFNFFTNLSQISLNFIYAVSDHSFLLFASHNLDDDGEMRDFGHHLSHFEHLNHHHHKTHAGSHYDDTISRSNTFHTTINAHHSLYHIHPTSILSPSLSNPVVIELVTVIRLVVDFICDVVIDHYFWALSWTHPRLLYSAHYHSQWDENVQHTVYLKQLRERALKTASGISSMQFGQDSSSSTQQPSISPPNQPKTSQTSSTNQQSTNRSPHQQNQHIFWSNEPLDFISGEVMSDKLAFDREALKEGHFVVSSLTNGYYLHDSPVFKDVDQFIHSRQAASQSAHSLRDPQPSGQKAKKTSSKSAQNSASTSSRIVLNPILPIHDHLLRMALQQHHSGFIPTLGESQFHSSYTNPATFSPPTYLYQNHLYFSREAYNTAELYDFKRIFQSTADPNEVDLSHRNQQQIGQSSKSTSSKPMYQYQQAKSTNNVKPTSNPTTEEELRRNVDAFHASLRAGNTRLSSEATFANFLAFWAKIDPFSNYLWGQFPAVAPTSRPHNQTRPNRTQNQHQNDVQNQNEHKEFSSSSSIHPHFTPTPLSQRVAKMKQFCIKMGSLMTVLPTRFHPNIEIAKSLLITAKPTSNSHVYYLLGYIYSILRHIHPHTYFYDNSSGATRTTDTNQHAAQNNNNNAKMFSETKSDVLHHLSEYLNTTSSLDFFKQSQSQRGSGSVQIDSAHSSLTHLLSSSSPFKSTHTAQMLLYLHTAAQLGNVEAQYTLSHLSKHGFSVPIQCQTTLDNLTSNYLLTQSILPIYFSNAQSQYSQRISSPSDFHTTLFGSQHSYDDSSSVGAKASLSSALISDITYHIQEWEKEQQPVNAVSAATMLINKHRYDEALVLLVQCAQLRGRQCLGHLIQALISLSIPIPRWIPQLLHKTLPKELIHAMISPKHPLYLGQTERPKEANQIAATFIVEPKPTYMQHTMMGFFDDATSGGGTGQGQGQTQSQADNFPKPTPAQLDELVENGIPIMEQYVRNGQRAQNGRLAAQNQPQIAQVGQIGGQKPLQPGQATQNPHTTRPLSVAGKSYQQPHQVEKKTPESISSMQYNLYMTDLITEISPALLGVYGYMLVHGICVCPDIITGHTALVIGAHFKNPFSQSALTTLSIHPDSVFNPEQQRSAQCQEEFVFNMELVEQFERDHAAQQQGQPTSTRATRHKSSPLTDSADLRGNALVYPDFDSTQPHFTPLREESIVLRNLGVIEPLDMSLHRDAANVYNYNDQTGETNEDSHGYNTKTRKNKSGLYSTKMGVLGTERDRFQWIDNDGGLVAHMVRIARYYSAFANEKNKERTSFASSKARDTYSLAHDGIGMKNDLTRPADTIQQQIQLTHEIPQKPHQTSQTSNPFFTSAPIPLPQTQCPFSPSDPQVRQQYKTFEKQLTALRTSHPEMLTQMITECAATKLPMCLYLLAKQQNTCFPAVTALSPLSSIFSTTLSQWAQNRRNGGLQTAVITNPWLAGLFSWIKNSPLASLLTFFNVLDPQAQNHHYTTSAMLMNLMGAMRGSHNAIHEVMFDQIPQSTPLNPLTLSNYASLFDSSDRSILDLSTATEQQAFHQSLLSKQYAIDNGVLVHGVKNYQRGDGQNVENIHKTMQLFSTMFASPSYFAPFLTRLQDTQSTSNSITTLNNSQPSSQLSPQVSDDMTFYSILSLFVDIIASIHVALADFLIHITIYIAEIIDFIILDPLLATVNFLTSPILTLISSRPHTRPHILITHPTQTTPISTINHITSPSSSYISSTLPTISPSHLPTPYIFTSPISYLIHHLHQLLTLGNAFAPRQLARLLIQSLPILTASPTPLQTTLSSRETRIEGNGSKTSEIPTHTTTIPSSPSHQFHHLMHRITQLLSLSFHENDPLGYLDLLDLYHLGLVDAKLTPSTHYCLAPSLFAAGFTQSTRNKQETTENVHRNSNSDFFSSPSTPFTPTFIPDEIIDDIFHKLPTVHIYDIDREIAQGRLLAILKLMSQEQLFFFAKTINISSDVLFALMQRGLAGNSVVDATDYHSNSNNTNNNNENNNSTKNAKNGEESTKSEKSIESDKADTNGVGAESMNKQSDYELKHDSSHVNSHTNAFSSTFYTPAHIQQTFLNAIYYKARGTLHGFYGIPTTTTSIYDNLNTKHPNDDTIAHNVYYNNKLRELWARQFINTPDNTDSEENSADGDDVETLHQHHQFTSHHYDPHFYNDQNAKHGQNAHKWGKSVKLSSLPDSTSCAYLLQLATNILYNPSLHTQQAQSTQQHRQNTDKQRKSEQNKQISETARNHQHHVCFDDSTCYYPQSPSVPSISGHFVQDYILLLHPDQETVNNMIAYINSRAPKQLSTTTTPSTTSVIPQTIDNGNAMYPTGLWGFTTLYDPHLPSILSNVYRLSTLSSHSTTMQYSQPTESNRIQTAHIHSVTPAVKQWASITQSTSAFFSVEFSFFGPLDLMKWAFGHLCNALATFYDFFASIFSIFRPPITFVLSFLPDALQFAQQAQPQNVPPNQPRIIPIQPHPQRQTWLGRLNNSIISFWSTAFSTVLTALSTCYNWVLRRLGLGGNVQPPQQQPEIGDQSNFNFSSSLSRLTSTWAGTLIAVMIVLFLTSVLLHFLEKCCCPGERARRRAVRRQLRHHEREAR